MDKSKILTEAKKQVAYDEEDEEYPINLFCAIRAIFRDELSFKEVARIVLADARSRINYPDKDATINWHHIFSLSLPEGMIEEEKMTDFERAFGAPKSSLGNLMYLEAFVLAGDSIDQFVLNLSNIKEEFRDLSNSIRSVRNI